MPSETEEYKMVKKGRNSTKKEYERFKKTQAINEELEEAGKKSTAALTDDSRPGDSIHVTEILEDEEEAEARTAKLARKSSAKKKRKVR